MSFTEISCKRSVRADVRKVSSDCKGHGNTEIAFKLDDIKIPLIRICYDYSLGTPIYTRHYLQGHAIQCKWLYLQYFFGNIWSGNFHMVINMKSDLN